jgi:hypothetical protein
MLVVMVFSSELTFFVALTPDSDGICGIKSRIKNFFRGSALSLFSAVAPLAAAPAGSDDPITW